MKKILFVAAATAVLAAAPAMAGTVLTTSSGTTSYGAPAGSSTVMTFDSTGSAVAQAATFGYQLTRAGVSGRAGGAASGITGTSDGTANTTGFDFYAPSADTNGFYGVGGTTSSGVVSYAQFLGTQALSSISLFIGSIDSYNKIDLLDRTGTSIASYTGNTIFGSQTTFPGSSDLRATFTGNAGTTYYGIKLSNNTNQGSFEFDNLSFTNVAAVPEPVSWAMMIVGVGAIGFSLRSAKRRSDAKFDAKIKRIALGAAA